MEMCCTCWRAPVAACVQHVSAKRMRAAMPSTLGRRYRSDTETGLAYAMSLKLFALPGAVGAWTLQLMGRTIVPNSRESSDTTIVAEAGQAVIVNPLFRPKVTKQDSSVRAWRCSGAGWPQVLTGPASSSARVAGVGPRVQMSSPSFISTATHQQSVGAAAGSAGNVSPRVSLVQQPARGTTRRMPGQSCTPRVNAALLCADSTIVANSSRGPPILLVIFRFQRMLTRRSPLWTRCRCAPTSP